MLEVSDDGRLFPPLAKYARTSSSVLHFQAGWRNLEDIGEKVHLALIFMHNELRSPVEGIWRGLRNFPPFFYSIFLQHLRG